VIVLYFAKCWMQDVRFRTFLGSFLAKIKIISSI